MTTVRCEEMTHRLTEGKNSKSNGSPLQIKLKVVKDTTRSTKMSNYPRQMRPSWKQAKKTPKRRDPRKRWRATSPVKKPWRHKKHQSHPNISVRTSGGLLHTKKPGKPPKNWGSQRLPTKAKESQRSKMGSPSNGKPKGGYK